MGRRKPYPHEELVQELRKIVVGWNYMGQISDDSDQWHVGAMGYSPMVRQVERWAEERDRAVEIARQLVEIGEPAAQAVALGLRMQGTWREYLLPYAKKSLGVSIIREALDLVAERERDPLAAEARTLTRRVPVSTSD